MYTKEQSRKEYIHRINRVIDYLEENIEDAHSLESIARVANFSPYHFHRIFKTFTGETLNVYIRRIRLQRAASSLITYPEKTVTEVAIDNGFNSPEVFCRSFKEHFKKSTTEFRNEYWQILSKNDQSESKNRHPNGFLSPYISDEFINQNRNKKMEKNISVKDREALNLVYCRHTGAFDQIGAAFEKLMAWAGPRGLLNFPQTHTVTVYHDDPKVTDPAKVRQSACITVDKEVKADGEFGTMSVPASKCAVGHFDIHHTEFTEAWDAMCNWLSESGYQPSDGLPYEYYYDHSEGETGPKFVLDICIPVKPL